MRKEISFSSINVPVALVNVLQQFHLQNRLYNNDNKTSALCDLFGGSLNVIVADTTNENEKEERITSNASFNSIHSY
jgi:hypothetical protein